MTEAGRQPRLPGVICTQTNNPLNAGKTEVQMPWDSLDANSAIVLNILGGFLAGIAVLSLQQGWNFIDRRLNRRVAVRILKEFFQGWESANEQDAADETFQFAAHERRIHRMNENITVLRPHLSGSQVSELLELIRGHEDMIEIRRRYLSERMRPELPQHLTLLPEDYRKFFAQAKSIKWLKL